MREEKPYIDFDYGESSEDMAEVNWDGAHPFQSLTSKFRSLTWSEKALAVAIPVVTFGACYLHSRLNYNVEMLLTIVK